MPGICNGRLFQQLWLRLLVLTPRSLAVLTTESSGQGLESIATNESSISTGMVHGVCLADNLIARVEVVLEHAPGCRTDTHNAQLFHRADPARYETSFFKGDVNSLDCNWCGSGSEIPGSTECWNALFHVVFVVLVIRHVRVGDRCLDIHDYAFV